MWKLVFRSIQWQPMQIKSILRKIGLAMVLVVALIAFLPAKLVLYWFPVVGLETERALISGLWWDAQMRYGQWSGVTFTSLRLRWQPHWQTFNFSNWSMQWQSPLVSGNTHVTWPLQNGQLDIQQAQLKINLAHAPLPNLQLFGIYEVQGQLSISVNELSVRLIDNQHNTHWRDWLEAIHLSQPIQWQSTPLVVSVENSYGDIVRQQVFAQGQGTIAALVQSNGYVMHLDVPAPPTIVSGDVVLDKGLLNSKVKVQFTPNTPNILTQLLPLIASDDGQQQYSINGAWRL